jgi:glycosyltransferase involved in cell wall biosynthesis
MKIAIVSPVFPPYRGGIGTVAHTEALELFLRGHEVSVFSPDYKTTPSEEEKRFELSNPKKVPDLFLLKPLLKYGNAGFLPQLFWRLKNFDVVHLHYPFFGGAEVIWPWKFFNKKTKLIITYHHDVVGDGWKGKFFDWHTKNIMPLILKSADKILVSSLDYIKNSNARDVFEKYRDKFEELPFGLDIKKFSEKPRDFELLEKHNLKIDEKIILFVGGLDKAHYFKGLEYLIGAKCKISDAKLLVVGEGDLRTYYRELAGRLGIHNDVIFAGKVSQNDLPKYYNLADVAVLPSIDRSEAFGIVLTEAMACGKPVIASDLPGVRSVVENEANGFLVEPENEKILAEKINLILLSQELKKKFGEKSRRLAEEKYNIEKVTSRLEKILGL